MLSNLKVYLYELHPLARQAPIEILWILPMYLHTVWIGANEVSENPDGITYSLESLKVLVAQFVSSPLQPHGLAHCVPLSIEFFRQEYWIGLSFPSPGDLPHSGTKPMSPALQTDSSPSETPRKPKMKVLVAQSCPTLCDPVDCSLLDSSAPWNSPGKNTGVGSHYLLQGVFLTQGWNLSLLHCKWTLNCLSHQRSRKATLKTRASNAFNILEWLKNITALSASWDTHFFL